MGTRKALAGKAVQLPYFGGRLAMRVVLPTGATTPGGPDDAGRPRRGRKDPSRPT